MKNRVLKSFKRTLSIVLCTVMVLTSFCFFSPNLIMNTAKAATYTKVHAHEYYYAPGTQFVTYLGLGGNGNGDNASSTVINAGYTLIDKDLNASAGGDYVYLGYKMGTDVSNSLRGLRISINDNGDSYTASNSITYTKVGISPISDPNNLAQGAVDLNKGKSRAAYLYYMGTKNAADGAPITAITVNNDESFSGYETVKYVNPDRFDQAADANYDAGGQYIFTHIKRLPEVDTSALRSAMTRADDYISKSALYVDINGVVNALANAKKITDAYDNAAGSYEAFSTTYSQSSINVAKGAIDDAIAVLQTKLDWTNFNKAVSAANALNPVDYYDFSSVRTTVDNAVASKTGLTTQAEVDALTAKINAAVSSLVKKGATTKSYNGATINAAGLFQSSVVLSLYNVNTGSSFGWYENDTTQLQSGEVYIKTSQYDSSRWNASTARVVVDCDEISDLFQTGVRIGLNLPWVYSKENRARWGVELFPYNNGRRDGQLGNGYNSTTVTSSKGQSLTYTLCDSSKNTMPSAETCNGDFDRDANINSNGSAYGEYSWYLKGAVPKAGDSAVVRVVGICASWAYSNNLQMLSEWTDLTIVSVSKKALKAAANTIIADKSLYTADSYANYESALKAAKAVINKTTESQTEIDTATNNLKTAIANLKTNFDMTALFAARDKANSLNSADYTDFSKVAILVSKIPNTIFTSQAEVDEFTTELNIAISKLVRKNPPTGSQTASYSGVQVWPSWARVDNTLKLTKADTATSSSFVRNSDSGDACGYIGDAYDSNGYRNVVRYYPSTTKATYNLDRYNYTNLSQLGNIIEATATTGGRWHQQSLSLYNTGTINSYDQTSVSVAGSKTGKAYQYSLTNGGFMLGASDGWYGTSGDFYNVRSSGISGPVPDAGDSIIIRPMVRSAVLVYNDKTIIVYNGYADLVVNAYDTTALRQAISRSDSVVDKSKYTASSYVAYTNALNEATATINSGVINQDTINAKTSALNTAIDNLERISTVTFDQQSATTAGTTSVVAIYGKAMPSITLPSRTHYSFDGYYSLPNGQGEKYYNADGSSAKNYDSTVDITLYANWIIDTFEIKFVNSDGTVLRSANLSYGSTPAYSGDEPTKAADATNHYAFNTWSPEITAVTGAATYTATFTGTAHNYEYKYDTANHWQQCADCNYKKDVTNHTTQSMYDDHGHWFKCTDPNCDYEQASHETHKLVLRSDSTSHWQKCESCSYSTAHESHVYVVDPIRKWDDDVHHLACACGATTADEAHTLNDKGECTKDGCDYVASTPADYSEVDELIASAPTANERKIYYTDETVEVLNNAINAVKRNYYSGAQSKVDEMARAIEEAINNLEVKTYPVVAEGGSYEYNTTSLVKFYKTATITAPATNNSGAKFAYWLDTETGKVASTYRNYTFMSVAPRSFRAVYGATPTNNDLFSSKVVAVRDNLDGTVSILVEHSASSKVKINAHGVLFTFDGGKSSGLVYGAADTAIYNPLANSTATTRTGLFEVKVAVPNGVSTIYVRPVVVDNNTGEAIYGTDPVSFSVAGVSAGVNSLMSITVSEFATGEEEAPTPEQVPTSVFDIVMSFIAKVVNFIKTILGI